MFYLIVTNDKKVIEFAKQHGAGVFQAMPHDESKLQQIPELKTENEVLNLIRKLGIKSNVLGYDYIKYILGKCLEDSRYCRRSMTKEIYPDCAKAFNTTESRVERAIRHALQSCWYELPEKFQELFGAKFFHTVPKNSEFICVASEYLHNR